MAIAEQQQQVVLADIAPSQSPWARAWRFIRTWPVFPGLIIAVLISFAIFAPLIANQDPEKGDLFDRNVPPMWYPKGSSEHIPGADPQGYDVFSRVVFGAHISLTAAAIILTTGAIGGTIIGLVAGYFGGHIDEILMRFVDLTFAIPFILVALVVVIVMGQSPAVITILLAIFGRGVFARQVRGETLMLREKDYVAASKAAGATAFRIQYRPILPGVFNT